jgi:hypothetical protein
MLHTEGETMEDALTIKSSTEEAAQLQLAITQCLTEVDHLREQMSRDQMEIDRSRTRTRALLAELKTTLGVAGQKAA